MPSCSLQLYYTNVSFQFFLLQSHTHNEAFIKREPNKQKKDLWAINNCCWWTYSNKKKWKGSFPKTNNMLKRPTIYSTQEEYCSLLNETWPFTCFFGRSYHSFLFTAIERKTCVPSSLEWWFKKKIFYIILQVI